jgi:hypothetical protein
MADHLQPYLQRFEPLKMLPIGPTLTEDEAIKWLVDEAFRAGKLMIRTHHKEDIIRFIVLAQCLDGHGYSMIWFKGRGVVGAKRKSEGQPSIINATKEMQYHADKRVNAGPD